MTATRKVRAEAPNAAADDEVQMSGLISQTRVWAEVKISVRPAEYEGITVTMGEARDCQDTKRDRLRTAREILRECSDKVQTITNEIKQGW